MSKYPFKNLAFRAGGVKGIAYAGAIKAMEEKGITGQIERISGSSAGSITAVALAMGYNADQMQQILHKTHFASFMDKVKGPVRKGVHFLEKYGLYQGRTYLEWMRKLLTEDLIEGGPGLGLGSHATFKEFANKGGKDVYIMATDLNTKDIKEFSLRATPNVQVAEACRASMAIPAFFPAWKFEDQGVEPHLFVDGGVLDLFPVTFFDVKPFQDPEEENFETMGLYLANVNKKVKADDLDYGHIFKWARDMFETGMQMQQFQFAHDPSMGNRTALIDDHGISGTDFDLSDADQKLLYDSGYNDTKAWLEAWKPIS